MTIKHTKTKWQREGLCIYALNENGTNAFFASLDPHTCRGFDDEETQIANAKLIAAAPSLLFALEWIVDICNRSDAFKEDLGAVMDSEYIINIAKKAIKLAEEGT
jgi:hypothetical protein